MSDPELLARYVATGDTEAFRTLVERHIDLVYSVARRHLRDAAAAEDVVQIVFVELYRTAQRIKPGMPLVAWLHLVSRRMASNARRGELRRQARENAAAELQIMNPPPPAWTEVEPLLDEAVESLPAADRTAILLRYFESKSLREVGAALGLSDDAAQKRVTRAVERLRDFFLRRGVVITTASLTIDLSAHAIQTAPAGLGLAISNVASLPTMTATAAVVESTRVLAMTTLQKSAVTAVLMLAAGITLFEGKVLHDQRAGLRTLAESNAALAARVTAAHTQADTIARALDETNARLAVQRAAAAQPKPDPAAEAQMRAWFQRVQHIRDVAARNPDQLVPEVRLLNDEYWFELGQNPQLADDIALRSLRGMAKATFMLLLSEASNRYVKEHGGQLPAKVSDLKPFLRDTNRLRATQADEAAFARYAMRYTGALADVPKAERAAVFIEITSPDEEKDQRMIFGPEGGSLGNNFKDLTADTKAALSTYNQTKPGATPASGAELLPYFNPPLSPKRQARFLAEAESLMRR